MLDSLTGDEGYRYVLAVMESIQVEDDYGAYQAAGHAAWRFGEQAYCRAIIHELPRLIAAAPYWAGDFLVSIANGQGTPAESTIRTFNGLLAETDPGNRAIIDAYIAEQEVGRGWLIGRIGVMGSKAYQPIQADAASRRGLT